MRELEKIIRENKASFDDHSVDKVKMWERIEPHLEKGEPKVIQISFKTIYKIAAAIALFLALSIVVLLYTQNRVNPSDSYAEQSVELQEIDMYYSKLVTTKINRVKNSENLTEEDKSMFLNSMEALDKEYETLKKDLDENLDNTVVLEAIVTNYRKRIKLLERFIGLINQSKPTENENGILI